jgi:diketogulonate reductase-like aldo/keto reductase
MQRALPVTEFAPGEVVPVLGQGTWKMGVEAGQRNEELASIRLGIELGMTLIDTAEMYADGEAEKLVGEAITGSRDKVFLVSKISPVNATRQGTVAACERSLRRLRTDRIDLYLLHWHENIPVAETVEGFTRLIETGKIRYWGVSNFDLNEMEELIQAPHGSAVSANQVMYNLSRRGIEFALLPWSRTRRIVTMAYSPLDQGRLSRSSRLRRLAAGHGTTPAQLALAWLLRQNSVVAIPKMSQQGHVITNRAAADLSLSAGDLSALDFAFPTPARKIPLEMT